MTAASFADDMITGGGKYAAVFHIAGMPWAVTTSTELVAALSDPDRAGTNSQKQQHTYRRLLFGEQQIAGAVNAYPSDHVQIIPSLDADLGKQSISYDESKGLTGGGWSVKFKRGASGADYSHFRSGAVNGTYDGLDVMPDPIYDATVKTGILALDWDGSGAGASTLSWGNDAGLAALVAANDTAGIPTYVWMQNSCLAIDGNTLAGPVAGVYSATAYSGCLRTVREKINTVTQDNISHMMVSAPATSIIGMPAILWLIPMTADGDIVDIDQTGSTALSDYTAPVMFRCGPVQPNPKCGPEQWEVSCGFWQDYLNVDVPIESDTGMIRGYRFHRQSAPSSIAHTQMGHLELLDYDSGATTYQRTSIWLCAAGDSVYFPTKTALAEAVHAELNTRTFSDVVTYPKNKLYSVQHKLMTTHNPTVDKPTFVNGPCAWILALGQNSYSTFYPPGGLETPRWEIHFEPYDENYVVVAVAEPPDSLGWLFVPDVLTETWNGWDFKIPGGMQYYYQWNFRSNYHAFLKWDTTTLKPFPSMSSRKVSYWPLPYHTANPRYRLSLKKEFNTQNFADGEIFTVGGPDGYYHLEGKVASTADNYVEVDTDYVEAGVTMLKSLGTGMGTSPHTMYWGQPLYYWPALHDGLVAQPGHEFDKFPVNTNLKNSSNNLADLFRGILGDSSSLNVPRRTCLYHVPDAWDDTYDMREVVDWDRLDQLAPPALNTTFALQPSTTLNIKKAFFNSLLAAGIRQTWGYVESIRAYAMSFEAVGIVSPAKAITTGRIFDNSNLKPTKPSAIYGNTWLFHHAEAKYHYQGDKALHGFKVQNDTGRAMLASGNKTLKVDDKIIQLIDPAADLIYKEDLVSVLKRLNSAQPSVSLQGTAKGIPLAVVGGDCLVSSDLPYDLFKGARGMTRRSAMVTKVATAINKERLNINLNFRLAAGVRGIGPAIRIAAAKMVKVGGIVACAALNADPTANEFASQLGGLTDLAHFGCFDWNAATDTVSLRSCSCAKYAITIVDENTTTWDNAGAGRNVFRGRVYGNAADTLELADITNGTAKISIDADYANFDETTNKIMYFAEYDHANLQQCQKDMYGWSGDAGGVVTDSSAATRRAMGWV